jgi:hypothetical protein
MLNTFRGQVARKYVACIAGKGDTAMSEHDAGYFRRHDRINDQRRSIELHGPMQLPWPRNLFGDMASVEELLAEHFGENPGEICRCGCDPVPRIVDARYAHIRQMARTSQAMTVQRSWFAP